MNNVSRNLFLSFWSEKSKKKTAAPNDQRQKNTGTNATGLT